MQYRAIKPYHDCAAVRTVHHRGVVRLMGLELICLIASEIFPPGKAISCVSICIYKMKLKLAFVAVVLILSSPRKMASFRLK